MCPLLLVALALWIECRLPRPRLAAPIIAVGAALLMFIYPWGLIPRAANPQNLAPILLSVISESSLLISILAFATLGFFSDDDRASRRWFVGAALLALSWALVYLCLGLIR